VDPSAWLHRSIRLVIALGPGEAQESERGARQLARVPACDERALMLPENGVQLIRSALAVSSIHHESCFGFHSDETRDEGHKASGIRSKYRAGSQISHECSDPLPTAQRPLRFCDWPSMRGRGRHLGAQRLSLRQSPHCLRLI